MDWRAFVTPVGGVREKCIRSFQQKRVTCITIVERGVAGQTIFDPLKGVSAKEIPLLLFNVDDSLMLNRSTTKNEETIHVEYLVNLACLKINCLKKSSLEQEPLFDHLPTCYLRR